MSHPDLSALLSFHEKIRTNLNSKERELRDRESELRAQLESCLRGLSEIEDSRKALDKTEALYRSQMPSAGTQPLGDPADAEEGDKKPRARIGGQRYLMFVMLRLFDALSIEDIAAGTHLAPKRVRDQMVQDLRIDVVSENEGRYSLTPKGLDLLKRYEAYKRARGELLPGADSVLAGGDDEEREDDSDTQERKQEALPVGAGRALVNITS